MAIAFTCTCGQTLTAQEQDVGLEIRCPSCSNLVRVPGISTGAETLGYGGSTAGAPTMTPRAIEMLRQTTLWVRIMAVMAFVSVGLMVVGGLGIMLLGAMAPGKNMPSPFLGCFYAVFAVIYIFPAMFLWKYASFSKSFALFHRELDLENALQAQKSFWKYVAIMALVMIALYLLAILIAIAVLVMKR